MALEADEFAARLRAEFPGALRGGQVIGYFQPGGSIPNSGRCGRRCSPRWPRSSG
jgi:hypothetical protein